MVKLLIDNGAECNLAWKGTYSSGPPLMRALEAVMKRVRRILSSYCLKTVQKNLLRIVTVLLLTITLLVEEIWN